MPKENQPNDFGEKIGGARKDLWGERGLLSGDLNDMNNREIDKFVKKNNIWKKPDYMALIADGVPVPVVFFRKMIRDSLPAKPKYLRSDDTADRRRERQEQYIDTIREIQAFTETIETKADVMTAYERFLLARGYYTRSDWGITGHSLQPTEKANGNPVICFAFLNAIYVRSDVAYRYDIERRAKREQFGVPREKKLPKGFEVKFNNGNGVYSKDSDWAANTYFVTRYRQILETNLGTEDEAIKWAQEYAKQHEKRRKRFVPEQLAHIQRDGPDYLAGNDIQGEDYLAVFGFRGGEFGNWMSTGDRQASLNMGFEALKDLAAAMGIKDRDLSLNGTLAIAFGARGSGSAVAHYEPMRQVINLTKMRGAGSLAHEWWHALDDFMGQQLGVSGLLTENPLKHPLFKKLVDTMKFKLETQEQAVQRVEHHRESMLSMASKALDNIVFKPLEKAGDAQTIEAYNQLKKDFITGQADSVERLSSLKKSATGHVIGKEDRQTLASYQRLLAHAPAARQRISTEYFENSKQMSELYTKDGGYWDSNSEMAARAFATYIMDRLRGRSDYLVGHAECAVGFDVDRDGNPRLIEAFPQGDERAAINDVFDEIVVELKRERVFAVHDRQDVERDKPAKLER